MIELELLNSLCSTDLKSILFSTSSCFLDQIPTESLPFDNYSVCFKNTIKTSRKVTNPQLINPYQSSVMSDINFLKQAIRKPSRIESVDKINLQQSSLSKNNLLHNNLFPFKLGFTSVNKFQNSNIGKPFFSNSQSNSFTHSPHLNFPQISGKITPIEPVFGKKKLSVPKLIVSSQSPSQINNIYNINVNSNFTVSKCS